MDLDSSLEDMKNKTLSKCENGAVLQKRFNHSTGKVKLNSASIGKISVKLNVITLFFVSL